LCLLLCFDGVTAPAVRADAWQELLSADKEMAAKAADGDLRGAFLNALTEDSIILNPGPASARDVWLTRAEGKDRLQWALSHAEVSISGDLGYTLGPWQYTAIVREIEIEQGSGEHVSAGKDSADAKDTAALKSRPDAYGHLLNIWQRTPDGVWRLLLNHSIRHGKMPLPGAVVRRGSLFAGSPPEWPVGLPELRKADLEPAGAVRPTLVSADFVRLRDGRPPDQEIESEAFEMRSSRRMETGLVISGAGDLAVTWGGGANSVRWLRVWRRPVSGDPPGLGWRLAVDLSQAATKPVK